MSDNNTNTDPNKDDLKDQNPDNNGADENNQAKTDKEINFEKLRKAKDDAEKKAAKLEAELKAKQELELIEQGKLKELAELRQKEVEDYKTKLQQVEYQNAVRDAIAKEGVNPKFVKFIQSELKDQVKIEDGKVEGLTEALAEIKKEYPEWFEAQTFGTLGTSKTASGGVKSFTPEQIADPAFYKANRDKILEFLSNQK